MYFLTFIGIFCTLQYNEKSFRDYLKDRLNPVILIKMSLFNIILWKWLSEDDLYYNNGV